VIAGKGDPGDVSGALGRVGVVVTRPLAQAQRLCDFIEEAGGTTIKFPVLEIRDPKDTETLLTAIDALDSYDLAIFISPNAVGRTMNRVLERRRLPATLQVAAIGGGTARELVRFGAAADICPKRRFDSEAMLELPEMKAVAGKRIVVFRGDGGRELLGQTLRQRGAVVDYVESYQRVRPQTDANPLMSFWARGGIDVFTVTSSQSLHNLFELVGSLGQQWLRETPLVVIGKRTADLAARMGLKRPALLADEASDEGIVRKLIEWRAS
jgi:uroporphyrinogen-III synthase